MRTPVAIARRAPHALMTAGLAPILLVQARRTARRMPRLDPASGAAEGTVAGPGPELRLMVLGESTAVGVGAAEHSRALPGFLALALRENLQRTVTWSVHGRHGATARRLIDSVIPELDDPAPDVVVVTIGINDLARRRSFDQWRADLSELIGVVRSTYERTMILVAGMPPVHTFPSLPQPLRYVLGARAKVMDRIMREVVSAHGATYVATDESFARDSRVFASDGLHPSSEGYRLWATELARAGCLVASETSDQ